MDVDVSDSSMQGECVEIITRTYTATDDCGNSAVYTQRITRLQGIAMNPTITPDECEEGGQGTITLNPEDGTAPYSYIWSNSQTTQTITGLVAGIYIVTVTDLSIIHI